MSYTDYLKRMVINSPKVIDTQMRLPDASSYTWRKKLESTRINRRTDHVINNSQDLGIAPRLFSPAVRGYPGTGFGGKVQDASSYTLSRGAHAIGRDTFRAANGTRRIHTVTTNTSGGCLASTPASQVVSQYGNSEGNRSGLNMGYIPQTYFNYSAGGLITVDQVGQCTAQFRPLTKSHFVDTIPDVKFHKSGTAPQPVTTQTPGGRQDVQNPIYCVTTNTSGVHKVGIADANGVGLQFPKAHTPFNSYSALPNNSHRSGPNRVHGAFVTSPTGPQVGGQTRGGVRADKVGGVSVVQKGTITHRGWGGRTRTPYPYMGREGNQPPAPAQLKINDPNHYMVK
jgi:hypothetical protein